MFNFLKSKFSKFQDPAAAKGIVVKFKGIKLREQVYLIVSLIVISLIFFAFYKAITFIASATVKSFEVDEIAVQSQVIRFNLEDYEQIVPKLIKK